VPRLRLGIHHGLGAREVLRRAALDGVRRQCEGGADEADEGHLEARLELPDGVEDIAERRFRVDGAHPIDVGRRPDGVVERRALALHEVEAQPHGLER
jgi:hypothetical protein